jgi:hypothetical protein
MPMSRPMHLCSGYPLPAQGSRNIFERDVSER